MKLYTIDQTYYGEYKSMNSKFIGILLPFENKSFLNQIINNLKKEHSKANHICYAYRVGIENEEVRANDDGEPSGSAGKPILNQLYSYGLQNCILCVVRYFGGTKLGVPGLIEAYKEASIDCLNKIEKIELVQKESIQLHLDPGQYFELIKILKMNKIDICDSSYLDNQYSLKVSIKTIEKYLIEDYI